ncbi:metallophosphoesterase family protein [bacterium]|nr:metallophosphoesterase family protein [bacterium]
MSIDSPGRFAVFSDIHGNRPALQAFLEDVASEQIVRIFCCGDIVGYGAHPNQCCDLIRKAGIPVVRGNHDQVAVTLENLNAFNDIAARAISWTHDRLTPENREFLEGLPYLMKEGDFTFVHSSPRDPRKWDYVLTRTEAMKSFDAFDTWLCFIGHSHQPFAVDETGRDVASPDLEEIELSRDRRYLINVGSVGQPRDRNAQLCYATIDPGQNVLRFHRLSYPVEEAQQAILEAGLPPQLAERLTLGW